MASTPVSELSDGPVLSVINKRLRALRKKHSRILQMEESRTKGKTLNKEQEETLRSKSAVIAAIDELEKLRQPLAAAVVEEINLSTEQRQVSPAESALDTAIDSTNKGEPAREGVLEVEDLLNLLYFGSMFDVKSLQSDFTPTMLTRTMERACCLSYDCMPDDESTDVMDLLGERDLDLISMLSGLLVSRPVNSPLSHKHALQKCIEHAKLWLSKSEQPIEPNSDTTYAGLRSKLDKIIASLYFTTDPVKVEAAAGKYGSYSVPVEEHVEAVTVDVPLQVDAPSVQYEQKSGVPFEKEELKSQSLDAQFGKFLASIFVLCDRFSMQCAYPVTYWSEYEHNFVKELISILFASSLKTICAGPATYWLEEAVSSQAIETNDIHISNNIELQQGGQDINQPAEPEEVVFEVEGVDNMKDADFNEQQSVPRRSYQNQNYRGNRGGSVGDHRGYSNGRGGRGRGGSYQNGRNQYYDQSGNYQQRNYNNYRGRGGRGGGGGYNHYASGDQAGSYSASDLR
ncbi:hypothetical protein H5410_001238 [Solanum commersonii]|uniref:Glycine-rich protein n=1 Tax=Solanum commersonii TaxID=4109 RepID=A0A9J6AYN2_SOLCO|nr:hypothetical protein H5410_001238 [Solanum commersonii]